MLVVTPPVHFGFGSPTLYHGIPNSFWDKLGEGYDNFYINEAFVQKFSPGDVRNLFINTGSSTAQRRWATTKFGQGINFNSAMPMMRVAEMYLIEAEAKAELGEADAGALLFALQRDRDETALKPGNTGQALVDEILLERRKELYGELGINFLDLKRRHLPLRRTGNHAAAFKFTIPANDPRNAINSTKTFLFSRLLALGLLPGAAVAQSARYTARPAFDAPPNVAHGPTLRPFTRCPTRCG